MKSVFHRLVFLIAFLLAAFPPADVYAQTSCFGPEVATPSPNSPGWYSTSTTLPEGDVQTFCIRAEPPLIPAYPPPSVLYVNLYDMSDWDCAQFTWTIEQLDPPYGVFTDPWNGTQPGYGASIPILGYTGTLRVTLKGWYVSTQPLYDSFGNPAGFLTCDKIRIAWKAAYMAGLPPPSTPVPPPPPPPPPVTGSAQGEPGCDPEQLRRMREYAEGHVLREVAITEEEIEKPDSTQILTCLDKGFGESAKAGKIFSDIPTEVITDLLTGAGSGILGVANLLTGFIPGLGNVGLNTLSNAIGYVAVPAFTNFIGNFLGSLGDLLSDIVGGALGFIFDLLGAGGDLISGLFGWLFGGTDDFECDAMGKLWDAIIGSGVNPEYTYFTYDDFVRAQLPLGTGVIFEENTLEGEGPAIRQKSMDAVTMEPGDPGIPYYLKAPDFTGEEKPEDVIGKF